MSDSEDPIDLPDEGGDDLFGDDDGDIELPQSDNERAQSDKELASDNDAADDDARIGDDDDDDEGRPSADQVVKERTIMNVDLFRHRVPKTKNGNLSSMKVPKFLKWQADEYKPATFEPSRWDMENAASDNPKAVIRYKRDEHGVLKSNTNIHRWSDGSITMAVGNEHYEVQRKHMIPNPGQPYEERLDSHYYAAAAHLTSNLLMTVGHISEQFTVNASKNMQDEALANFASAMAAAARGKRNFEEDVIITTTKDPELQKKEAELAEKERMKAQRRRDTAAAKLEGRASGYKSNGGGLSIGDLEGGRKAASAELLERLAQEASSEYDSDDDLPAGTRYREDDYDEEDDFIAASDDDGELVEDDDDDLLDDEEEEERPRKKRQKTVEPEEDDDADGDADEMDTAAEPARSRRRHIVDDDDDDDE